MMDPQQSDESAEMHAKLQVIELNYERAQNILMEQYDAHMKQILPKPELLPVRLDLVVERLPNQMNASPPPIELLNVFSFKPFESLAAITDAISQFYEKRQEVITVFEVESITL